VEIDPPTAVLDGDGATQRFIVRATYADGTDRDVTNLAVFSSNNDNSAVIAQDGTMTAKNRGEAFIMARYDTHTVGSHVIVLPKGLVFQWSNPPANNYVDQLVNAKLLKLRINPSELCTDEEFIRRVSLDICGTLPTSDELQKQEMLKKELGDILWFIAGLASNYGWNLEDIAQMNLNKLEDRKNRNVIQGSGDNR
jgi:hypothetical protein